MARRHHRRHRNRRRYHRNPRMGGMSLRSVTNSVLTPAAVGAVGGVGLDVIWSYVNPYLPAQLQSGMIGTLAKGAGAIGIGMVSKRFLGAERAKVVTLGALTVVLYGAIKNLLGSGGLNLGLPGLSDYTHYPLMGAYMPVPVAGYHASTAAKAVAQGRGRMGSLGYASPAPIIRSSLGAYMAPNVMGGMDDGM